MADLGDFTVLGAMFGKPVLHFTVVPHGKTLVSSPAQSAFSRESRLLSPNQNTTISAIAILEIIRPNMTILEKVARKQAAEDRKKGVSLKRIVINSLRLKRQLRRKYPKGYFEETHPRLRVYHNPFAAVPLPSGVFRGPYDQHTWIDPKTGQTKTWQAPTKFKKAKGQASNVEEILRLVNEWRATHPNRRSKEEIDRYLEEERASWGDGE